MFYNEHLVFPTGGRSHYRIPSVIVTQNGTVLAFCNDRRDTVDDHAPETDLVMASKGLGERWSPVRSLAHVDGWACTVGAAVYDENVDVAFCSGMRIPVTRYEFGQFTEEEKKAFAKQTEEKVRQAGVPAGDFLLYSKDAGTSWNERALQIEPYLFDHRIPLRGSCHGSGAGITLRHGEHAGRLLCPSRVATGEYHDMDGLRKHSYNNAIYSDDHGLTWKASAPVQAGTGEGTLMETADGSILYNSRAYYEDRKRYLATSVDGGASFGDFRTDGFLTDTAYMGCNASLLRVAGENGAVTVFANPRSADRDHLTASISFDDGKTWTRTKLIHEGRSAYSSLAFSHKEQAFYLLYELGDNDPYDCGIMCACFDLEWLLKEEEQ